MTPDVKHLAEDGRFEFFFDLLKFPSKLTLFTGGPLEEERLKKHLSEGSHCCQRRIAHVRIGFSVRGLAIDPAH